MITKSAGFHYVFFSSIRAHGRLTVYRKSIDDFQEPQLEKKLILKNTQFHAHKDQDPQSSGQCMDLMPWLVDAGGIGQPQCACDQWSAQTRRACSGGEVHSHGT